MDPVLETSETSGFTHWPVADLPAHGMLVLSGELSPLEVGTAMAILATYNDPGDDGAGRDGGDGPLVGGAAGLIRRLLDAECVLAQGGVRVQDLESGATLEPGCCFGLESWRDWLDFTRGVTPWLGHSPEPYAEHLGSVVRLWPDRSLAHSPTTDPRPLDSRPADTTDLPPLELRTADLPDLLTDVQDKLRGFLRLVERWADRYVPSLTSALVAKLDEDLGIGGPLAADE
ncbi:hypothetical protein [Streptomyces piniterrae]|nr:hypothetical protein [Streptomyces piniterrae]